MEKLKSLILIGVMLFTTFSISCLATEAKLTAYNDKESDSLPYGHCNCQGSRLEVGQCAADLRYHYLGQRIYIEGLGIFTVADCGSAIVGKNRYDIYVSSLKKVDMFGVQYRDVQIINKHFNFYKHIDMNICKTVHFRRAHMITTQSLLYHHYGNGIGIV